MPPLRGLSVIIAPFVVEISVVCMKSALVSSGRLLTRQEAWE